ncbi:hypothetical protein ACFQ3S_11760 [Mucilaginibacter terrae]|uniref:hypothetical protein n=1 Tax=Mucilaginibacter terrae TaxID=1955052 RepID=UPI00362D13AA
MSNVIYKKAGINNSIVRFNSCFYLLIFILTFSCKQSTNTNKPILGVRQTALMLNAYPKKVLKVDTILNSITGNVDDQRFTITCNSAYSLFILNQKRDTIYQDSVYSPHQQFVDFNNDGYKDILIEYMTNVPGITDVLIYDKDNHTFKKVIDLQKFPGSKRIPHSNYYYSYHRSGCADMNWDSDLFYIKNYRTIRIGNISGRQCHDERFKDGIYINQIVGDKKIKIVELPINTIKNYKDYKWGFINQYWKRNYREFL